MINNRGFTLIELLIVVVLLGILGVSSVMIFYSTLAGGGKATAVAVMKEYGDAAVLSFERQVRNAIEVDCVSQSKLVITNLDESTTTFLFENNQMKVDGQVLLGEDVTVTLGEFNCALSDVRPDIVELNLELQVGDPATDKQAEIYTERFDSKVTLRNY